jgi:hypothetical protein
MATRTFFTFLVQALGGKYLADDIGGARIVIRDADSGVVLADRVTQGDSGQLIGNPNAEDIKKASKFVVAWADGSYFWFLVPGATPPSGFTFSIELDAPRRVQVTVSGPVGGLGSQNEVTTELWLAPGKDTTVPGIVIALPGLLVQPTAPLIHSQVAPGTNVGFAAKVTMMCGCQVGDYGSYWPFPDFEVSAIVQKITDKGLVLQDPPVKMDYAGASVPSTFASASQKGFQVPASGSGTVYYQAAITAYQKGTGNTGTGIVNFYCTY